MVLDGCFMIQANILSCNVQQNCCLRQYLLFKTAIHDKQKNGKTIILPLFTMLSVFVYIHVNVRQKTSTN